MGDDCLGETGARLDQDRLLQHKTFQQADDFIQTANEYLAEIGENQQINQAAHGAIVTDTQCVAIRYVLNEVYIHCEDDGLSISNSGLTNTEISYFNDSYAKGLNVFLSNIPASSGTNPDGFAYLRGTTAVVENFSAKLIAHEIGHNLNLRHTFRGNATNNDGCDDTPWTGWEYDQDNDGIVDNTGSYCFNRFSVAQFGLCTPDGTTVVNTHPCCEDEFQDNNVMTYSTRSEDLQQAAFTPCQMDRMLEHLIDFKCDLIEDIDPPCPPTSAFIGILPSVDLSVSCNFTLYLGASSNESEYQITYSIQQDNGDFSDVRQTEWIQEEANKVGVAVGSNRYDKFTDIVLIPKTTYRIVLATRNDCGNTDQHAIEFTTPECGPLQETSGEVVLVIADSGDNGMRIFPNPTYEGSRLEYTLNKDAEIEIFFSAVSNDGNYEAPVLKQSDSGYKQAGSYIVDFHKQEMEEGINFVIIRAGEEVHVRRIVKR